MAQYKIRVGTVLQVKGSMLDDYVVERVRSRPSPEGTQCVTVIEARTVRQRCFPRALTDYQTFDSAYILGCLKAGSMIIQVP